jgi:4-amino-4-deoxy-L-arabinose transferase-like glycosyltransferase
MSVQTSRKSIVIALAVIALLTALRAIYLQHTFVDLTPDEAQYWLWSKYPDWSYYSKGPLVAWLISGSTHIFGDTILGVKFFALMGMAILSFLCFLLARSWKGDKAGFYALALVNATPLLGVGGLLMVPDMPVAVLWVTALFVLHTRAEIFSGWKRFVIIGFLIGIAGLAKYTAGLFYPLVGLYFLVNKKRRVWLIRPHIYVSGIISLLCLAPIFIWNKMHDFVGFKHVLGQVGGEANSQWVDTINNFLGGQAAVTGGLIFIFLVCYWVMSSRSDREEKGKIFWWFSAPLFAFFCIKAFGAKVQPNWPVLSILVGFIGLSGWLTMREKSTQRLFIAALTLSAILTVAGHDTQLLRYAGVNISAKKDPLKPALGWHGLGEQITQRMKTLPSDTAILTTRYQTASALAFYVKDKNDNRPEVLYVNPGYRRQNQFDYWPWPKDMENTLYINEADLVEDVVRDGFSRCAFVERIQSTRPNPSGGEELVLKEVSLYICSGYKGMDRLKADKF